jgi:hypothetical protein
MKRDDRWRITLTEIPDPILAETLEMIGIQYVAAERSWFVIVGDGELDWYVRQLEQRHVSFEVTRAEGRGQVVRYERLSDQMVLAGGGSPNRCALCGAEAPGQCTEQIECDDTDSPDYPGARTFFVCPNCYAERILPSPRAYATRQGHVRPGGGRR